MIIVTGGAGFIGSNLVKALNQQGHDDIIVVDDLTNGHKFTNLVDCQYHDYLDQQAFLEQFTKKGLNDEPISAVFHQGACSDTTEWNGKYMMANNYEYSKCLLHACLEREIPFIYASSAATYGNGKTFVETPTNECPINVYGYSKFLFDQYVRRILPKAKSQIAGMRYFNVYGPREQHKASMASVAFHHFNQYQQQGKIKLFAGCDGYSDGEQRRDFIYVDDAVAINLWFMQHSNVSGIYNVGTGKSQPFNDIANAVLNYFGKGQVEYIPFPDKLKGHYQSFTEADLTRLRAQGCDHPFLDVKTGIKRYFDWLTQR